MNRRDFLKGVAAGMALPAFDGCLLPRSAAAEKSYLLEEKGVLNLGWPSLTRPFRMWVIGDTHLAMHDVRDAAYAQHIERMARWPGKTAAFEKMLAKAREERPDVLVLVGDAISFPTLANVEYLRAKLEACGVPWLYTAGNHDWHFEGDSGSDLEQRARWVEKRLKGLYRGANPLAYSRVINGVRLVMIDNSVYHILPEQVDFWRAEAAKGDPVCLCMHIPFWVPGAGVCTCANPTWGAATDPYWMIERRERWAERLLPSTFEFREAVLATPNLVGVFAGHIHRLQAVRLGGQNQFTVRSNSGGAYLDVRISDDFA